jgi:hypothetical protein
MLPFAFLPPFSWASFIFNDFHLDIPSVAA